MVSVKPLYYKLNPAQPQSTNLPSFWHNQFIFMWLMYVGITCAKSDAFTQLLHNSGVFSSTAKTFDTLRNSLSIVHILHLFQCFVEAGNNKAMDFLLENIFKDGIIYIKGNAQSFMPLFLHHMLSLVHFLTKSSKAHKGLEFVNCFFLDDVMNTLEEYFTTNPKKGSSIQSVHFENCCVVSKSNILGTIVKVGHISSISIVNIGNYEITNMIESLGHSRKLHTLNMQLMGLVDSSIELLMQKLSRTTLKLLNIAYNICTISSIENIANFISNSALQILNISGNMIGASEEARQHFLARTIPVDTLRLYSRTGVEVLATALKKSPSLLSLNLSINGIVFIKELALALSCNRVLMSLDLSSNLFFLDDQSSFDELGSALQKNNALKSLNISCNGISDDKMNCIVDALYYNKTLQLLDVSGNKLSCHTTKNLAHALEYNSHLCLLAIGSNDIGDEGAIHLASIIKQNKTLTSLYLRGNMITDDGAVAIADALGSNKNLRKLDLSMNEISDKGISALCNSFHVKNALKILFIVFNPVSSKEIFTKFAADDATLCHQNHVFMTDYGVALADAKITVHNSDKPIKYFQKFQIPACRTANFPIWYTTTNDKRILAFTFDHDISYHKAWKDCLSWNISLQYMYAHASINHPNNMLEEECLQCYMHRQLSDPLSYI